MNPMICWWDEKANLGIYCTPDGTFGTYSRPYGVVMGQAPANTPIEWQEIDACHGMNWDWKNMAYDLAPREDVIKHYPATGNWPKPIPLQTPTSPKEQVRNYLLSFDGE